jgi:putative heme iron utilization protein
LPGPLDWADVDDFSFAASDYARAQADPLVEHKSDIIQHMNADHNDALILLARQYAGIEAQDAALTSLDRLGFHLRLKTQDGMKGTRIAFLREVRDPAQAREVFVEMLTEHA